MSYSIEILTYSIYAGNKVSFANDVTGVIDTLNPHSYVIARKDKDFQEALKSADILIPDGVGIQLASRILTGRRIEKIAGSDLHEIIINSLANKGGSCFYLGSSNGTLDKIRQRIMFEHPSIRVGVFSPPFREVFSEKENKGMIKAVNDFSPDVLFIGMTAPKQEKWVHENRSKLNVPVICSIGAVFDFYAGTVRRPGKFWVSLGLEWLPRFLREPQRLWRRNLVSTPLFLWLVFFEKIKMLRKIRQFPTAKN